MPRQGPSITYLPISSSAGLNPHQRGDARQSNEPLRMAFQQVDEILVVSAATFTDRNDSLFHASLIHLFEQ